MFGTVKFLPILIQYLCMLYWPLIRLSYQLCNSISAFLKKQNGQVFKNYYFSQFWIVNSQSGEVQVNFWFCHLGGTTIFCVVAFRDSQIIKSSDKLCYSALEFFKIRNSVSLESETITESLILTKFPLHVFKKFKWREWWKTFAIFDI